MAAGAGAGGREALASKGAGGRSASSPRRRSPSWKKSWMPGRRPRAIWISAGRWRGSRIRSGGGSGWSTRWPGWMCCCTGSAGRCRSRRGGRRSGMRKDRQVAEDTWPVIKATAADLGAWLCWEDESGQGLRPPKGAPGAPRLHSRGHGDRRAGHAGVAGRADRGPARVRPRLIFARTAPGGAISARGSPDGLRPPPGRRAPATAWSCRPGLGRPEHPRQPRDARLITARDWLTVYRLPPYAPS